MKSLFTKALVYSIGTIVVSAAVFSITMAGLNLAGKTDVTKQVIEEMDEVLEDLDNLGTNPFNYALAYPVVADLIAELPYRPELKGVVDIPSRALRYGSKFIDVGRP